MSPFFISSESVDFPLGKNINVDYTEGMRAIGPCSSQILYVILYKI